MKGEWVQDTQADAWHLIVGEEIVPVGPEDVSVIAETWCGKKFDDKAPRKEGALIDSWGDIVHDDCYRRSEEL